VAVRADSVGIRYPTVFPASMYLRGYTDGSS
jgi:hypothetical protein